MRTHTSHHLEEGANAMTSDEEEWTGIVTIQGKGVTQAPGMCQHLDGNKGLLEEGEISDQHSVNQRVQKESQHKEGNQQHQERRDGVGSGAWPPTLGVRRQGQAMEAFLLAANASTSAEAMSNVTPTFTDALEWVREHSAHMNKALRLLHLYPNLIQDRCLDGLWDFLLPFFHRGMGLRVPTMEEQHLALHGGPEPPEGATTDSNLTYWSSRRDRISPGGDPKDSHHSARGSRKSSKLVYLSCRGDTSLSVPRSDTASCRLLTSLAQYCFVCCASARSQTGGSSNRRHIIRKAQVLVFFLNNQALHDPCSVQELEEALRHSVPVLMLREKGFELPSNLPANIDETILDNTDTSTGWTTKTVSPTISRLGKRPEDTKGLPRLEVTSPQLAGLDTHYNNHTSGVTLQTSSTEKPGRGKTLGSVIRKLTAEALEYDIASHEACFELLCCELSHHLGNHVFLTGSNIETVTTNESKFDLSKNNPNRGEPLHSSLAYIPIDDYLSVGNTCPNHGRRSCRNAGISCVSTSSAPEYTIPWPPSSPISSRSQQHRKLRTKPSTQLHGRMCLPPIGASTEKPLWKHRSQELPSASGQWDVSTNHSTTYMVLRKPGQGAEFVTWPPLSEDGSRKESECEFSHQSQDDLDFLNSDSDTSITFALSSNDINFTSLSPTPDFV